MMKASKLQPGIITTCILHHLGDGVCYTIDELEGILQFNRRQISNGAAKLILRGFLERVERGCFQLTRNGLEAARRGDKIKCGPWRSSTGYPRKINRNTFRQRAWTAMRMKHVFTFNDLVICAASPKDRNPLGNLKSYIRLLCKAGFVAELPKRKVGTRPTSSGFKQGADPDNSTEELLWSVCERVV